MPSFRLTISACQVFPGDNIIWLETALNNRAGPICVPANYFSNPEVYGFPQQPSPWGFTEERRATLALYDYRRTDARVAL